MKQLLIIYTSIIVIAVTVVLIVKLAPGDQVKTYTVFNQQVQMRESVYNTGVKLAEKVWPYAQKYEDWTDCAEGRKEVESLRKEMKDRHYTEEEQGYVLGVAMAKVIQLGLSNVVLLRK
jgi:hypothetical protein